MSDTLYADLVTKINAEQYPAAAEEYRTKPGLIRFYNLDRISRTLAKVNVSADKIAKFTAELNGGRSVPVPSMPTPITPSLSRPAAPRTGKPLIPTNWKLPSPDLDFLNKWWKKTKPATSARGRHRWTAVSARPRASMKLEFDDKEQAKLIGRHPENIRPKLEEFLAFPVIQRRIDQYAGKVGLAPEKVVEYLQALAEISATDEIDERTKCQARWHLSKVARMLDPQDDNTDIYEVTNQLIFVLRPADWHSSE